MSNVHPVTLDQYIASLTDEERAKFEAKVRRRYQAELREAMIQAKVDQALKAVGVR